MVLSVLSIGNGLCGLFDSVSGEFIMTGPSHEMYRLKHEIEEAEQQDANKVHLIKLFENYIKMLSTIKMIGDDGSKVVEERIKLFQKLIDNK